MKKIIVVLVGILSITACKKSEQRDFAMKEVAMADSTQNMVSGAASQQDSSRAFIKTAEVDMEVKEVYRSTLNIEQAVYNLGGFVNKSELRTNLIDEKVVPIDQDSATKVRTYSYTNAMVVRVPQKELGNFLMKINKENEFLNVRIITSDDVSLNLKAADLDSSRINQTNAQLKEVLKQDAKTLDKSEVISQVDAHQQAKNEASLHKMSLKDQVNFATISINISEPAKKIKTKIANIDSVEQHSNFGYSFWKALRSGFYFFQDVVIGLAYLWPFYILFVIAYILYRKYKKQ